MYRCERYLGNSKHEKGQTLIEVLIGLGAAVLIISSMTIIVITSLNNTNVSKTQNLAAQYAQEGIEIARNLRDSDYATFSSLSGNYCLQKGCTTINTINNDPCGSNGANQYCSPPNVDGIYSRAVKFSSNDASCNSNTTKVTVSVSWNDAKCGGTSYCHSTSLVSCFTKINNITAP